MNNHNYVKEAVANRLQHEVESGHILQCFNQCKEKFTHFYVFNYLFYNEAQQAFDLLDEQGKLRHELKFCFNRCEKEWQRYQTSLKDAYSSEVYGLLSDYCLQAYIVVEKELTYLRVAIHNILLQKEINDAEVNARLLTALCLWDIIDSLWKNFFESFKRACLVDFSEKFEYANLTKIAAYVQRALNALFRWKDGDFSLYTESAFKAAYNALGNKLSSSTFLEQASRKAIGLTESLRQKYAEDLAKLERKKEDLWRERLATKYKVV